MSTGGGEKKGILEEEEEGRSRVCLGARVWGLEGWGEGRLYRGVGVFLGQKFCPVVGLLIYLQTKAEIFYYYKVGPRILFGDSFGIKGTTRILLYRAPVYPIKIDFSRK